MILRAKAERERRRREKERRQIAPPTFRDYVSRISPRYRWYRHCEVLADVLQKVADGKIKRLLVFTPPRHGKSETISRLFTSYFLHRYPDRWVGLSSYSADLANTLSRNARDNFRLAGNSIKADASGVQHWETGAGGGLWACGAGGPATGKGFHCFPAGTMVETDEGSISIDTLYRLQDRPKVLSFNHETQSLEWRSVLAAITQPGRPLVEIVLHSGRRIRCTADHPIYCVERGYREAATLVSGETVIQVPPVQELPDLRRRDGQARHVYELPCQSKGNSLSGSMRALWRRVYASTVRLGEVFGSQLRRFILQRQMQPSASRRKESQAVQVLQGSRCQKYASLLRGLSPFSLRSLASDAGHPVWFLPQAVSPSWLSHGLLWQGLRQICAFSSHERERQQPLQNRDKLYRLVSQDASGDPGKRWPCLRNLRSQECSAGDAPHSEEREASCQIAINDSPYRPSASEQQSGEPCNPLLGLSRSTSRVDRRWQTDTVSSVIFLCDEPERVYDIQVEGNSNFFAEGVLVHNCGVVDDPIKNAEEAASETIRAKLQDWWNSTWYTREEPWGDDDPSGAMIVVQTRWHEDDLAGWLLRQEKDAEDDDDLERWHIVNLPAIAEDLQPDQFPPTCSVEPDWRQPGEALCPERRPIEKLRRICKRIGEYFFQALFQQRPTAREGEFFKVSKIETVEATPADLRLCRGWDLASIEGGGAYTSGVLLGVDPKGVWYVLDVNRGQWSSDDVETQLISTARRDGTGVRIHLPQDPGQAGKKQSVSLTRMLAGFIVKTEPASGSKETRAFAFSAQVNVGNVKVLKGAWNKPFIEELRQFPRGKYKDQVDSAADAFNEMALAGRFQQWDFFR